MCLNSNILLKANFYETGSLSEMNQAPMPCLDCDGCSKYDKYISPNKFQAHNKKNKH